MIQPIDTGKTTRFATENKIAFGFAFSLVLQIIISIVAYFGIVELVKAGQSRFETHLFIVSLEKTSSAVKDAETRQRGYLIAGEESFLKPYQKSKETAFRHLQALEARAQTGGEKSSPEIGKLRDLIEERIAFLDEAVKLRETEGYEAAQEHVRSLRGKSAMDQIRILAEKIEERKFQKLADADAKVEKRAASAKVIIFSACLFSFFFLFIANYIISGDMKRRKEVQEKISRLNRELEAHSTQLEAVNKELEAFSYSVSHDLRAPLRHIDGFVDLLMKNKNSQLDDKSKRHLSIIGESAKQMGALIDDLLVFSRMGRTEMASEVTDMQALVTEVRSECEPDPEERKVKWLIAPLPKVQADRSMLKLVWTNLITNALKYSRPREEAVIEIGYKKDQGMHVFFVKDNGVGFDMRYLNKLFGVFQRLHNSEDFEGTGIGLANVRRIITRHGGNTWAESVLEEGATFYFSIPLNPVLQTKG